MKVVGNTIIQPFHKASCHCGAVEYEFRDTPEWATECNCSICRRLGTLWIYSDISNVVINAAPDATLKYVQGNKPIAIHGCRTCGCTTHWENLTAGETRMAVNLRLAEPETISSIPVRHFDGADKWEFLD